MRFIPLIFPIYSFRGYRVEENSWVGFNPAFLLELTQEQIQNFNELFKCSVDDYDIDNIQNLINPEFIQFVMTNCSTETYYIVKIPEYLFKDEYCTIIKDRDVYSNISGIFLNFDKYILEQIKIIIKDSGDLSLIQKLINECESHKQIISHPKIVYNVSSIIVEGTTINF